jgi:hypothetical protein
MADTSQRLYTRRDAVGYIKEKFGIPIGHSRIAKDAMGDGPFPKPVKRFGKVFLYEGPQLDDYAKTLIEDALQAPAGGPGRRARRLAPVNGEAA